MDRPGHEHLRVDQHGRSLSREPNGIDLVPGKEYLAGAGEGMFAGGLRV